MDAELKAYLDAMRVDLDALKVDFETGIRDLRQHTESVETRLLSEFWKWARTADARYRQHQNLVGGLEERVGIVEDRLADLERGGAV